MPTTPYVNKKLVSSTNHSASFKASKVLTQHMVRPTAVTMNLPNELLLETMQYLSKAELKNARLVSKLWAGCASDPLFDKLFISPHSLNLQVFVTIAENPHLSKCVKELEYDAVHFWPETEMTISGYMHILWDQTERGALKRASKLMRSDPEVEEFIAILESRTIPGKTLKPQTNIRIEGQKHCIGFGFIQEGYRKWMQEAHFEKENSEETSFSKVLIAGLKNLTRLRTVKLRGKWPSEGTLGREGSPLARSWHPHHARPPAWAFSPRIPFDSCSNIIDYRYITSALAVAGRTGVRSLSIENPTPPCAFVDNPNQKQTLLNDGIAAYSGVQNLKLILVRPFNPSRIECHHHLRWVQSMLESMKTLKRLVLVLPTIYDKVFAANGYWPQLTVLNVHNIAIGTKDLMTLLSTRMPRLRHLGFGTVRLLDGSWSAIIEYLKISHRLSSFHIDPNAILYDYRGRVFITLDFPVSPNITYNRATFRQFYIENMRLIMDYVNNGRKDSRLRHPSLLPHQSAQESVAYLSHISSLCGIPSMGDMGNAMEVPIDKMLEEAVRHLYTVAEV